MKFYTLDHKTKEPQQTYDIMRWQKWVESSGPVVCHDKLGRFRITTYFEAVDYTEVGPRFATVLEGGWEAGKTLFSPDHEGALKNHACLVAMARCHEAGISDMPDGWVER